MQAQQHSDSERVITEEALTPTQRDNVEKLNSSRQQILSGFNEVLSKLGIELKVSRFDLAELTTENSDEECSMCCCTDGTYKCCKDC